MTIVSKVQYRVIYFLQLHCVSVAPAFGAILCCMAKSSMRASTSLSIFKISISWSRILRSLALTCSSRAMTLSNFSSSAFVALCSCLISFYKDRDIMMSYLNHSQHADIPVELND